MARLGLLGRIGRAIANIGDAIADAVTPGRPRREARQAKETKAFRRGRRTSGKAAERYAQQRRDAEATRRANEARRRREKAAGKRTGPPPAESDYQRRRREARDRQRARASDPYLASWNQQADRAGYLGHRDFFDEKIVGPMDLDPDEKLQLWQDYITYMTKSNNNYRLNNLNNPWWRISGMHPDDFDWWDWREAMGYEHGARKR
jgi:hypothetical protein